MKRNISKELKEWKLSQGRKPLILKGARQVGKTYSLKELGKREYEKTHYFNFETEPGLAEFFNKNFQIQTILQNLSLYIGKQIRPLVDLIIFDEIQACPLALTSLKYFAEDFSDYHVACAGSLLGTSLSEESFPVGKIDYLFLGPMKFSEFLDGIEDKKALQYLEQCWFDKESFEVFHEHLWSRLLDYFVTGGLPEVVKIFSKNQDSGVLAYDKVRKIQESLIRSYLSDFTKHSGKINSMHIQAVFENVPRQLASSHRENTKRYKFKDVLPKKKGFPALEGPISWLEKAGLIYKVSVCNNSEVPLQAFTKSNLFKLYVFDIGILGAMLQIPAKLIIQDNYGMTKGYFAENFVAQALTINDFSSLYSWNQGIAEIEFLIQKDGKICPLEVKAGKNTKSKSLTSYINRYQPHVSYVLSGNAIKEVKNTSINSYPLYLAEFLS